MLDWDLIRYFLAVARTGSTLTAARELKQSQPTVARRIAALEESLGTRLFDRRQAGYRLTDEGRDLVAEAEAVEAMALRFGDRAESQKRRVTGTIRLTTFDMFAEAGLGEALHEFSTLYPDVQVEIVVSERYLDLTAGEADIAMRAGMRPTSGPLVVRKIAEGGWALYCSRDYAAKRGQPRSMSDLADHVVLGGEGHLATIPPYVWLSEQAPDVPIRYRCNTVQNMLASVIAGLGVSMLPVAFAETRSDLICCITPPELNVPVWLITHERLKDEPRIRAMMDFLAEFAARKRTPATVAGSGQEPAGPASAAGPVGAAQE